MIDGKPTIVLSYSNRFVDEVAKPIAEGLEEYGFRTVLVGEEPLPDGVDSNPNSKVEWFFKHSDMAVFLATPDDRLESGEVHTRPNIIDEHRLGQQLAHLSHRLLVFKADEVKLPSNINPVHERLPMDDPAWIVGKAVAQAQVWGVLPPAAPTEPTETNVGSSTEATVGRVGLGPDDPDATEQARNALSAAMDGLGGQSVSYRTLRRAELAIAGTGTGSDTLGVHLANSLFAARHEICVRPDERLLLFRTYLANRDSDNVPGIFWIKDVPHRRMLSTLYELAQDDSDTEVKRSALEILGRLGYPRSATDARALVTPFLSDDDFQMRWAGIAYVRRLGSRSLRDLLDSPELLAHDRHSASQAAALMDVRQRPSDVLDRYITDAYVRDKKVEDSLLREARRIGRARVLEAMRSGVKDVRRFGIRLAAAKGDLSKYPLTALITSDRSPEVRMAAIEAMLDADEKVTLDLFNRATDRRDDDLAGAIWGEPSDRAAVRVMKRLDPAELAAKVTWMDSKGAEAYEALGTADTQWMQENVRRDLRSDFSRLKNAARMEMHATLLSAAEAQVGRTLNATEKATLADVVAERMHEWLAPEKLGDFLTGQFRCAALRVLTVAGKPSDVEFARRFKGTDNPRLRVAVLGLLERFGTAHDSDTALALSDALHGETDRLRAAELAFRLAYKKDKLLVLKRLSADPRTAGWAVARLPEVDDGYEEAWKLLRADRPETRLEATRIFWDAVKPSKTDEVLSLYMRGYHYYNVVRAVDRRLYSPDWLIDGLADEAESAARDSA
jgi:HEAT repeats/Predicted nucleotide-binding protein containing TIR-like domain